VKRSRLELIDQRKLWHVHMDATPDEILCEGSKTACWRFISENHWQRLWRRGEVRMGQILWERNMGCLIPDLADDLQRKDASAARRREAKEYRKTLERMVAKQRALLTGLDCLEGQEELFQTDGQE